MFIEFIFSHKQNKLIAIEEADGILYTEKKVYDNETMNVEYPTVLNAKYVRAAHLYNVTFSHVRHCFAIAGLLSDVEVFCIWDLTLKANFQLIFFKTFQEVLQFDGVYFQKLMEKVGKMNSTERDEFFVPIKDYRIYA